MQGAKTVDEVYTVIEHLYLPDNLRIVAPQNEAQAMWQNGQEVDYPNQFDARVGVEFFVWRQESAYECPQARGHYNNTACKKYQTPL